MLTADRIDVAGLTPEELIDLTFLAVLRRAPDGDELAHWRQLVAEGRFTPSRLAESLAFSDEFRDSDPADFAGMGPDEYLRLTFLVILRRPIDPAGLEYWRNHIAEGTFTPQRLVPALVRNREFRLLDEYDIGGLSPEEYLDCAFRALVRRPPDPVARKYWQRVLTTGRFTPTRVLTELTETQEFRELDVPGVDPENLAGLRPEDYARLAYHAIFRTPMPPADLEEVRRQVKGCVWSTRRYILELIRTPEFRRLDREFYEIQHEARVQWIRGLPPFGRILDIGGSSPNYAEGALIELGYRYWPRELVIFDLPEDQQYWGKPKFPQDRDYEFSWGRVRYAHGRAERIAECADLADERFDLIFMGQTFEHIHTEAMPGLLRWMRDHLAPGGRFAFDTPNRLLTRLHYPDSWIDEDHKHEYTPDEAERLLADCGLRVVKRTGLVRLPESARTGVFNEREPARDLDEALVSDRPETCYLFALESEAA